MEEQIRRLEQRVDALATRLTAVEKEIETVKKRNTRVEGEKAWEISAFRKVLLTGVTYVASAIVLKMIERERFLIEALVPAVGYVLSTLSLPALKRWWIERH